MESGEDKLIARFFRPLATHPGALGLRDDAACLTPPPGHDLVLTTDAVVAGVHLFHDDPASALARKALRVNLSDLAAKGASPLGFLLSIALPESVDETWLNSFTDGLRADADLFKCPLLGGDTDRTPGPATVTVFMLGSVPAGTMVKREGAQAGDLVMVSGTVGDAALGLRLRKDIRTGETWHLDRGMRAHLLDRYLLPQPRVELAPALRTFVHAAMDVSDGLAGDLAKLCRVSGVSAEIETARIPFSAAGQAAIVADPAALETAVTGGDDYEIVCAVPPGTADAFRTACAAAGTPVTVVGEIVAGTGVPRFVDPAGRAMTLSRPSFSHF